MIQPKVPPHLPLSTFYRRAGREDSLYVPLVGFVFTEMTVEATNGPLVGFVFTKMPLKATNSPPNIVLWALGYVIGP